MKISYGYFLFLFSLTIIVSCTTPCQNVDCGTEGICYEGSCSCNIWYEHDEDGRCTVTWSSKFIGHYSVETTCDTGTFNHIMIISKLDQRLINLGNFGNFGTATVASLDYAFGFEQNNMLDVQGRFFDVVGVMDSTKNTIEFDYTVKHPDGSTETCSAICTRQ